MDRGPRLAATGRIRRSGTIVPREMVKLAQRGCIEIDLAEPWVGDALACVHVWPLDLAE